MTIFAQNGDTALALATLDGNIDCMRLLLQAGVNPQVTNTVRNLGLVAFAYLFAHRLMLGSLEVFLV
jgi:hypothetical protein